MASSARNWAGLLLVFSVPLLFLVSRGLFIEYQAASIELGIVAEQQEQLERRPALEGIFEWSERGATSFSLTVYPGLGDARRIQVPSVPVDGIVTIIGLRGAGLPDALVTFSGESGTARTIVDADGAYKIDMRVRRGEHLMYSYRFLRSQAAESDIHSIRPNRLPPDAN